MKNLFYSILICLCFFSCSDNDIVDLKENMDIRFEITSTATNKLSEIESTITNGVNQEGFGDLHIVDQSYSNKHLPYKQSYFNQTVYHNTTLGLHFQDNSLTGIGNAFEEYTITLKIFVNGKLYVEKEEVINESREVVNINHNINLM